MKNLTPLQILITQEIDKLKTLHRSIGNGETTDISNIKNLKGSIKIQGTIILTSSNSQIEIISTQQIDRINSLIERIDNGDINRRSLLSEIDKTNKMNLQIQEIINQ